MSDLNDRKLGKEISEAERCHAAGLEYHEALWTALPLSTQIVGLTGPPGVGKSTLAAQLIRCARAQDLTVGVVAVDPSSPFSGGALLGDRVRMANHAGDPRVFIRSMGSRNSTGGLAAATRSAVRLLIDNGADIVLIETVGIGQVELDVMHVADTVIVSVVPGLGDAVQMHKAGILEIADVLVVNQSDKPDATKTMAELTQAMSIGGAKTSKTPVIATSAVSGAGITNLWDAVRSLYDQQRQDGSLVARRLKAQRAELADQLR